MDKFKNSIQSIEYNTSENLVIQTWTKESENLKNETFKIEMLELAKFFKHFQPKRVLIDMRDFYFVVGLELQDWVAKNINSILETMNETKTAYIVSPDLFASVSVEQTVEETAEENFTRKFFDSEEEARKWLVGK